MFYDERIWYRYLCKKFGFGVDKICSHYESYFAGYGGNHGDPDHWLKKFGKNMNWFRAEVQKLLKANTNSSASTASTSTTTSSSTTKTDKLYKGDLVKVKKSATTYYSGKSNIPDWVKANEWYVKEDSTANRVVIDKSKNGQYSICSAVKVSDLELIKAAKDTTASAFKPYVVKVTADVLNIRKGPGTNYDKNGSIKNGESYTIVEEKTGPGASKWGKLKSGVGWISLDFVKKI